MSTDWVSTTDTAAIASQLSRARRVLITTHTKPDGDAVGSTLALARSIERAGRDADIVYAGPWPKRFDPVVAPTRPLYIEKTLTERDPHLGEPDAVVILDTGSWGQLTETAPWLRSRRDKTICIDHHRTGDADVASKRLIVPEASAAAEIVAGVCTAVLGVASAAELPVNVAEPLYLGIASDTGWFRHANTTPATLRLASELLSASVNHPVLYQRVEQGDRVERLKLIARALGSLELYEDDRIAVSVVSREDFAPTGGTQGDTGGFAEIPLSIATVRVSAALTEVAPGEIRLSLRSKSADGPHTLVDVNAAARAFGGGGHTQAAGARLSGELHSARDAVFRELRKSYSA